MIKYRIINLKSLYAEKPESVVEVRTVSEYIE